MYLPCILEAKKRYVGYSYESLEQKEPIFDDKGIETVRRDSCPAVGKVWGGEVRRGEGRRKRGEGREGGRVVKRGSKERRGETGGKERRVARILVSLGGAKREGGEGRERK